MIIKTVYVFKLKNNNTIISQNENIDTEYEIINMQSLFLLQAEPGKILNNNGYKTKSIYTNDIANWYEEDEQIIANID